MLIHANWKEICKQFWKYKQKVWEQNIWYGIILQLPPDSSLVTVWAAHSQDRVGVGRRRGLYRYSWTWFCLFLLRFISDPLEHWGGGRRACSAGKSRPKEPLRLKVPAETRPGLSLRCWPAQAANCCPHRPVTPRSCFHVTLWPLTWMYPMQSLKRKLIYHSEVLTKQATLSPAPGEMSPRCRQQLLGTDGPQRTAIFAATLTTNACRHSHWRNEAFPSCTIHLAAIGRGTIPPPRSSKHQGMPHQTACCWWQLKMLLKPPVYWERTLPVDFPLNNLLPADTPFHQSPGPSVTPTSFIAKATRKSKGSLQLWRQGEILKLWYGNNAWLLTSGW